MADLSEEEELELGLGLANVQAAKKSRQSTAEADQRDFKRFTFLPVGYDRKTEKFSPAFPQVAVDAFEAFKLPGDIYSGKVQLRDQDGNYSNEVLKKTFDLAGMVAPTPRSAAIPRSQQPVVDALKARQSFGRPTRAQTEFGKLAQADDALDMATRMRQFGPEATPMDVAPNIQGQAGSLASTPGRAQTIVRDAIKARDANANTRIRSAIDGTLGPAPVPSVIDDGIRANQKALSPRYEEAFANAKAVDTSDLALGLDADAVNLRGAGQKAAQKIRKMLNVSGADELDPNPRTLFETRQAIDGMFATEKDGNAIRVLSKARDSVDQLLHGAVPGIKNVDGQFAELANQSKALSRGQTILDSGRTSPPPAQFADEFQAGVSPQGNAVGPSAVPLRLREGTRAEIERIVGTNANDRVALQRILKGEGDWNRAKLATEFGQEKADGLFNILDAERAFADTSQTVTRNSETARRQITNALAGSKPQSEPGIFRSAANFRVGDAFASAGDKATGRLLRGRQEAFNADLAKIITSKDPNMVDNVLRTVSAAQKRNAIPARVADGISSFVKNTAPAKGQAVTPHDAAKLRVGIALFMMQASQDKSLAAKSAVGSPSR